MLAVVPGGVEQNKPSEGEDTSDDTLDYLSSIFQNADYNSVLQVPHYSHRRAEQIIYVSNRSCVWDIRSPNHLLLLFLNCLFVQVHAQIQAVGKIHHKGTNARIKSVALVNELRNFSSHGARQLSSILSAPILQVMLLI